MDKIFDFFIKNPILQIAHDIYTMGYIYTVYVSYVSYETISFITYAISFDLKELF